MEIIDAVLCNGNAQLRRSDITEDILSTLPQVQYGTYNQIHVPGAEYPEFVQPTEEHNRFMAQSSQQYPLFHEGKKELPVPRSSQDYVQWMERKSCFIAEVFRNQQAGSLKDDFAGFKLEIQGTSRILIKLADDLEYLRPGNESHLGSDINMRHWRTYWNELIAEMKTVHPDTSCLGVYVLTTWPYSEFLKTLALKLCDIT